MVSGFADFVGKGTKTFRTGNPKSIAGSTGEYLRHVPERVQRQIDKQKNLNGKSRKYGITAVLLFACGQMVFSGSLRPATADASLWRPATDRVSTPGTNADTVPDEQEIFMPDPILSRFDSLAAATDSLLLMPDSLPLLPDSLLISPDSLPPDTLAQPRPRSSRPFLDDVITGQNRDSLVYDLRNKVVYIYREGDVSYQSMNLKADYMAITMENKHIFAYGIEDDSTGRPTRPVFTEGAQVFTMDTIRYNMDTRKARIQGVATQEGEGFLVGQQVKKMPDNTINIAHGKYTTCDHTDHPHFYLSLTKGKLTNNKKVIFGPTYLVMEDVPIYFLGLPFGFFMTPSGRHSGFLMPEYGEEYNRGFFLRNGGYYFAFNDHIDLTARGGFYTLGSWESSLQSNYRTRYKFSGGINLQLTNTVVGEKGSADYAKSQDFHLTWTHTQDPKFRPNSNFAASVNFATSGFSKYGATNLNDRLNTQTNSSISYSKTWPGKPFSFSTNFQHSQNAQTGMYTISFPNAVFSVSRIFPLKRREAIGKERWYEKISLSYTGNLSNSVNVHEDDLFTEQMIKDMRNGVQHSVPVSTSFNLLKYLNFSPGANYREVWYFSKFEQHYDEELGRAVADTTYGFYRFYNYSVSASLSTKVYGMYTFGSNFPVQAMRHTLTPSVSLSYAPDFSNGRYGFYRTVQVDSTGRTQTYSPFSGVYGSPSRGRSASLSFSLQNTLEMKVKSDRDTTGVKKISILDNLGISSSYNFLAEEFNLSPFSVSLRTANLFGNFGLNLNATVDPYEVVDGRRVNQLMFRRGKLGRITSTGWSFGYTFNSSKSGRPVTNDITSGGGAMSAEQAAFFNDPSNQHIDPETRRRFMTEIYYDFDIPWNFGFNYSLSYSKPLDKATITQTLGFNGSVTPTPKWGISFNGGYDFSSRQLTPGVFTVSRDLHCWDMNFSWTPVGYYRSWYFTIRVKSAVLRDLKWEKRNSMYDNLYGF